MDTNQIIRKIKEHPEAARMGMIASHLGIVRGNSRNGRDVDAIEARFDREKIVEIINEIKSLDGIVEVIIDVNDGLLKVGDDLMFVAVGGDIRDNVFPALTRAVDLMKTKGGNKKELYRE